MISLIGGSLNSMPPKISPAQKIKVLLFSAVSGILMTAEVPLLLYVMPRSAKIMASSSSYVVKYLPPFSRLQKGGYVQSSPAMHIHRKVALII